ncbi:hypothetical protein ACFE04_012897 [Oxalis oulophora]
MSSSAHDYVSYTPIHTFNDNNQNVVVLLPYYRRRLRLSSIPSNYLRRSFIFLTVAIIVSISLFFLYPSNPKLQLARLHLNHININTSHKLTLDLSFNLTVRVINKDFFSLDYESLTVTVGYRGRELGFVRSSGEGLVRARGSSYVNATLELNGLEIIHDVFYLISDLANGVIPFDTNTNIQGDIGILFFKVPIKGSVMCEVYVNTNNQSIASEDCTNGVGESTRLCLVSMKLKTYLFGDMVDVYEYRPYDSNDEMEPAAEFLILSPLGRLSLPSFLEIGQLLRRLKIGLLVY